uniref:Uncharacterized protein n=1 Tax=Zea mays TaxID=4577 RepID=B6T3U5_MAIZE|nr:hypothetical protein [Zea mays]
MVLALTAAPARSLKQQPTIAPECWLSSPTPTPVRGLLLPDHPPRLERAAAPDRLSSSRAATPAEAPSRRHATC